MRERLVVAPDALALCAPTRQNLGSRQVAPSQGQYLRANLDLGGQPQLSALLLGRGETSWLAPMTCAGNRGVCTELSNKQRVLTTPVTTRLSAKAGACA
jgi:hypothetical protein